MASDKKNITNSEQSNKRNSLFAAFDYTSQYRSKREANSTLKGGLVLIGLIATGILLLYLFAYVFG